MKRDRNTEYVTQGEIQGMACTARMKVQAYYIKHVKDGNNFSNPKSGFWVSEEGSYKSLCEDCSLNPVT